MSYPGPSGGGSNKSGGFDVSGLGDFVKRHGAQVATTAISYKMGGKIGKVLAAGQAADLAHKYKQEQKYKNQQGGYSDGGHSSNNSYNNSYDNNAQNSNYSSSHKSGGSGLGLSSVLNTGKELLQKAEKTVKGKFDSHGGAGASSTSGPMGSSMSGPMGSPMSGSMGSPMSEALQYLVNGAVIELTSNMTGRPLQIVSSFDGSLVLDANGTTGAFNTQWTVVRVDSMSIMLHNNFNYVALNNSRLLVYPAGPGGSGIGDCRLTVHEPQQGVVSFADGAGQAVGVGVDGLPLFANYRQSEALFSIRFLFTPPPSYY